VFKDPEVILNNGERFDPFLTPFLYSDVSHIPRYEFALAHIASTEEIIDIACGTGWGTEILAKSCKAAMGVDISETAIQYARRKRKGSNLRFICSDFFDFNSTADTVISFETIEHLKRIEVQDILSKLLSLTRSKIVGSVPYNELPGNNPHHALFGLNESNFEFLRGFGTIQFYYQDTAGQIHHHKNDLDIQNLIFVFSISPVKIRS
jgi:SAM-dependent methyltransferase